MINFFPVLYEDELLFSVICRYKQMCGIVSKRALERDLFNQREGQKSVLFPIHLNVLISNLPPNSKITTDEVIWKHTMFPFYTSFLSSKKSEAIYNAMIGSNKQSIESLVGISGSKVKTGDYLRYCPLCFKLDMEEKGISYWRRLHQIPGVLYCPKHEVLLKNSNVLINDNRVDYVYADEENCNPDLEEDFYQQEFKNLNLKYIRNASYLLFDNHKRKDSPFIINFYIDRLREKRLASKGGNLYMKDIVEEFLAFYPKEYLVLMQSSVNIDQATNWLRLFVRNNNKNRSPLRHLLFLQFLGVDAKDLFDAERVIGKKTMKKRGISLNKVEERRKEWLQLIKDHPDANRRELKQIGKGLHTWIYSNDWKWYDTVTPRVKTRKKQTVSIDWTKRDEECLILAKKGYEMLLNTKGKPIRIIPSNIRRVVGVKRWFNNEKLVETRQFLNEIYEDIDSFRIRKIKWAIDEMIKNGEIITPYKIQLYAGFGGNNKEVRRLVMDTLRHYK